jgi:hypothetical protein
MYFAFQDIELTEVITFFLIILQEPHMIVPAQGEKNDFCQCLW